MSDNDFITRELLENLETSVKTLKSIGFDKDITIGQQMGEIEKLAKQIDELQATYQEWAVRQAEDDETIEILKKQVKKLEVELGEVTVSERMANEDHGALAKKYHSVKNQIVELRNRAAETIGDLQTHVKELRTKK